MTPIIGDVVEVLRMDGKWVRAIVQAVPRDGVVTVMYANGGGASAGMSRVRLVDKHKEEQELLDRAIASRKQQARWSEP